MQDNFANFIGIELLEVKQGYAKARLKIEERHLNSRHIGQGGALFTLADYTCAEASNSYGIPTLTANAHITYIKPAQMGYIYAEAVEVANHHRMPFYEVRISDENGELLAVFTSSGYRKNNLQTQ